MKKHISLHHLVAGLVILVLGLALGLPHINDMPAYIHAWAQADWYSIALGFSENGFDFFHPETFHYNKQFPGAWHTASDTTITSVDFPIHEYIVALLMGLFGTTAPWVFRSWTLVCSLLGMWFFYLCCERITGHWLKGLAVVVMGMTSPLYAYYFNSYLPCAPALALAMAGVWASIRYWQEDELRYWHWAIVLLTLSALIRTSFLVVPVAVCAYEVIRMLRKESTLRSKLWSVIPAVAVVIGYMLWNQHLRDTYGTLFLGNLRPAEDKDDLVWICQKVHRDWKLIYFTRLQQILMTITVVAAALWMIIKRQRPSKLWLLAGIWFVGEVMFVTAMLHQFIDHDYYFLDSLYLVTLFIFALALNELPTVTKKVPLMVCGVVLLLLGGTMYNAAKHETQRRADPNDRAYQCCLNYEGSAAWLDSLGVSREARILTPMAYPQNTPFIQMQRKGYALMWGYLDLEQSALTFPFDYVVVEDEIIRQEIENQQHFLGHLERLSSNGKLSLCHWCDSIVCTTAEEFLAIEAL